MLKLGRRARGHFVTLIEIRVHLILVISGHTVSVFIFPPSSHLTFNKTCKVDFFFLHFSVTENAPVAFYVVLRKLHDFMGSPFSGFVTAILDFHLHFIHSLRPTLQSMAKKSTKMHVTSAARSTDDILVLWLCFAVAVLALA